MLLTLDMFEVVDRVLVLIFIPLRPISSRKQHIMKTIYSSIIFLLLLISSVSAQNYYTSLLWGEEGHREYAPWSGGAAGYDGVLRQDGKLLVAGTGYWNQCNCFRVTMAIIDTACGAPDPSFGNNGTLSFQYEGRSTCHDVHIQDDGKILACGLTAPSNGFSGHLPAVYRLLADGAPDTTFNGTGYHRVSLQSNSPGAFWQVFPTLNGGVVCVGSAVNGITGMGAARFQADGSLDTTFSGDGLSAMNIGSVGYLVQYNVGTGVMLSDSSYVAIGLLTQNSIQTIGMVKMLSNGNIDTSFGNNGLNVSPILASSNVGEAGINAAIDANGKILVSGTSTPQNNDFFMARFNSNGDVDSTYATNGVSIVSIAASALGRRMELLPDGSTLQYGSQNWNNGHPRIVKRLADGSLDMSFGTNGIAAPVGPIYKKMYGGMTLPGGNIIAWGHQGQISVFKFTTDASEGIIDLGADLIGCMGDSVLLEAGVGYETYLWNTSDSVQSIYTSMDGDYVVSVTNALECADSDTVNVSFVQGPDQPMVTSGNGIDLATTATGDLQWYLDGVLISSATQATYFASVNGEYTVEVTDANGCSNISDPYSVNSVGIYEATPSPWTIGPNPVSDRLLISGPVTLVPLEITVRGLDGRIMMQKIITDRQVEMDRLSSGVFLLEIAWEGQYSNMRFIKL